MKYKKDAILDAWTVFCINGLSIKQNRNEFSVAKDMISEGSRVVKTARGSVEYSTVGEGSPALFIHGAGGGHDMGRFFAERISHDFSWICPSRFGYLRTPIPADASFESQADAYAGLLDCLHIEKAAIVGLSIGGPSALLFALRHPDRCAALILLAAVSRTSTKRPISDWYFNALFRNDFVFWAASHAAGNFLIRKFGVDAELLHSLGQEEKQWADKVLNLFHPASKRYPGIRNDQKASVSDRQYELDKIDLPTLILHARDDRLVDYEFAEYAHTHIPNSTLVSFPNGGHILLGQDNAYRDAVTGFLDKHLNKE